MADIYLTKTFLGFAARERISDATIVKAAREMQRQLYDANLGGCVHRSGWCGQTGRLSATDRISR